MRARLPEKRRKDAVLAIEYLITASPDAMQALGGQGRDAYFNDALKWLRERHGAANVVYAGIHRDEKTPHMYAYVVPLDETTGRLNARKWLGGAAALSEMQTEFAQVVGARHGLERGIKGSRAKHERVKRHYGLVDQAADKVAELGMIDRASLGIGKPTKKALEAIEAGDSYLTMAHEFQARQRAIKAKEKALFEQGHELRNRQARSEQQAAELAQANKARESMRQELEATRKELAQANENAALRREVATLRPKQQRDHGHGLG